jgi:hypothetical protein
MGAWESGAGIKEFSTGDCVAMLLRALKCLTWVDLLTLHWSACILYWIQCIALDAKWAYESVTFIAFQ